MDGRDGFPDLVYEVTLHSGRGKSRIATTSNLTRARKRSRAISEAQGVGEKLGMISKNASCFFSAMRLCLRNLSGYLCRDCHSVTVQPFLVNAAIPYDTRSANAPIWPCLLSSSQSGSERSCLLWSQHPHRSRRYAGPGSG